MKPYIVKKQIERYREIDRQVKIQIKYEKNLHHQRILDHAKESRYKDEDLEIQR